jgi:hypothetical protein
MSAEEQNQENSLLVRGEKRRNAENVGKTGAVKC